MPLVKGKDGKTYFDRNVVYLDTSDFSSGKFDVSKSQGRDVFVLLHAQFCGHCHKAMPAFQSVADSNTSMLMAAIQSDSTVSEMAELGKQAPGMLKQKGIEFNGYPTYFCISGKTGEIMHEFSDGRDIQDLQKHILKH